MVPEYLEANFRDWLESASVAALVVIAEGLELELKKRCGQESDGFVAGPYHESAEWARRLVSALHGIRRAAVAEAEKQILPQLRVGHGEEGVE